MNTSMNMSFNQIYIAELLLHVSTDWHKTIFYYKTLSLAKLSLLQH